MNLIIYTTNLHQQIMNFATEHKHFYKITKGSDRRGMTTGDTPSSGRISDLHQYTLLVETIWFIKLVVFLS